MRAWGLLLVLPLLLAGCSQVDFVNSLASRANFKLVANLPYGDGPRRTLDLYLPTTGGTKHPVVVFFYGGNWQEGKKEDYLFLGEALASRGFIVAIADYRLYPEIRYPDFIEDAAAATRWVLAHAAEYGGDPGDVSLMGHSAGGYIAIMLALDPTFLGKDRARIKCAVGLAGPYDFLPLTAPDIQAVFSSEKDLPLTQPITYADGTAPPVLLSTGRMDTIVYPGNVTRLAARIREHGGKVATEYYSLLGHITLIGSFAKPLRWISPVLDDTVAFLKDPRPSS